MAKTYRLSKRLSDDTSYYDLDESAKYVDYLEEQDRLVRIGNLLFDAGQLSFTEPVVTETVPEPAVIGLIGLGGLVSLVTNRIRRH